MLCPKTLKTLRSDVDIDELIQKMMTTSAQVAEKHCNLAELKRRASDRQADLDDLEISFLVKVSANGKNETERKAMLQQLRLSDETWLRCKKDLDDATHHRDMVQAELSGLNARLSAQRTAANLIAATLNASIEGES